MIFQLNRPVDRVITDARSFSDTLRNDSNVRHAWTLIRTQASPTATGMILRDRAGKGVDLASSDPAGGHQWAPRGGYEVCHITGNTGSWGATIANPGGVFSMILLAKQPGGFLEAVGIGDSTTDIYLNPDKNGKRRIETVVDGSVATFPIGPAVALDQWYVSAWVFNLAGQEFAASVNGDAFVSIADPSAAPLSGSTVRLTVGKSSAPGSQYFNGGDISDLIVMNGDIRNNPSLYTAAVEYGATGYGD